MAVRPWAPPRRTCEPWSRATRPPRRVRRQSRRALPGRARPPERALRRARRPDPRHRVGDRGRAARHGAAPAQAPRHLDAARRPHRRRRDPRGGGAARGDRGARPGRGSTRPPVPRLIHLDVHEAALGHTHLDLRYLLLGGDDDPHPPPGESPDARWYSWDEAHGPGRPRRWSTRLPVARAAYEALLVTDALDHLLAVQDLDTSITQLQHRRDALVETSGLAARGGRAGRRWRPSGRTPRPASAALAATQKELEEQIAGITERRDVHRAADVRRHQLVGPRPAGHERRGAAPHRAPGRARGAGAGGHARPGPGRRRAGRAARAHAPRSRRGPRSCGPRWRQEQLEIDAALAAAIGVPRRGGRPAPDALCPTATRRCGRASRAPARPGWSGSHCDGCHLELSSVEVEQIRALPPGEVATCEQCGRILVPG